MRAPSKRAAPGAKGPPRRSRARPPPIDAELCRAVVGVLYTLTRALDKKLSRQQLLQLIALALELIPDEVGGRTPDPPVNASDRSHIINTAHLLTIWRSQPRYLKAGLPRALPVRGPAPSIAALVHEVDPQLPLKTAMKLLRSAGALRKVGARFLPADLTVHTRGTEFQADTHLRAMAAVTSNFDHNAAPETSWPNWREKCAESPLFPISKLPQWRQYVIEQSKNQLENYDAFLHRHERSRDPREPTTCVGIEILQYDRSYREQTPEFTQTVQQLLTKLGVRSDDQPARRTQRSLNKTST